jgi:hypothetical protein
MRCNTPELVTDLPPEFLSFMEHLQGLKYEDRPNYSYLISLFENVYRRLGGDENTPFDWERVPERSKVKPRPIPSLVDISFLKVAVHYQKYPKIDSLPFALKSRLLSFLIRINNGALPGDYKKLLGNLNPLYLLFLFVYLFFNFISFFYCLFILFILFNFYYLFCFIIFHLIFFFIFF